KESMSAAKHATARAIGPRSRLLTQISAPLSNYEDGGLFSVGLIGAEPSADRIDRCATQTGIYCRAHPGGTIAAFWRIEGAACFSKTAFNRTPRLCHFRRRSCAGQSCRGHTKIGRLHQRCSAGWRNERLDCSRSSSSPQKILG